jgi:hypothetical protein
MSSQLQQLDHDLHQMQSEAKNTKDINYGRFNDVFLEKTKRFNDLLKAEKGNKGQEYISDAIDTAMR